MKKEKLGTEPAMPVRHLNCNGQIDKQNMGMSKRFYAANNTADDFLQLPFAMQETIIGESYPVHNVGGGVVTITERSEKYLELVLKGAAKWRYMKADELLTQENE